MKRFLLIFICVFGLFISNTVVNQEFVGDYLPPVMQPISTDDSI